jgi:hypothetical protein
MRRSKVRLLVETALSWTQLMAAVICPDHRATASSDTLHHTCLRQCSHDIAQPFTSSRARAAAIVLSAHATTLPLTRTRHSSNSPAFMPLVLCAAQPNVSDYPAQERANFPAATVHLLWIGYFLSFASLL